MIQSSPFKVKASSDPAPVAGGPVDWPALKNRIVAGLDVCAEYAALGVEFTGPETAKGWRACRAVGRAGNPDDVPSAAVHVGTGIYKDSGDGGCVLGFLDFALKHGTFGRWLDCVRHYAGKAGEPMPDVRVKGQGRVEEAHHDYRDASSAVRYRVWRYRLPNGKKTFSQHPPDGKGGWKFGAGCMAGVEPLPYRLPELLATAAEGDAVWIVEGEKDADRLASEGLTATTSHGGVGMTGSTWPRFEAAWFAGRTCYVLPDNDASGRAHGRKVVQWLQDAGAAVRVLELPDQPEKGDVSDWLDAGHTIDELGALAAGAPPFDPAAEAGPEPEDDSSRDATVADLRRHLVGTGWLWPFWMPGAALTLIAAEAGIGKTRLCMDLHSRLVHREPWPDGTPTPELDRPKALWVAADGQHQELADIAAAFGIPDDLVILNAPASDPFGGTSLQAPDELEDLEARIARVRPALVFIDTITNTADFKAQDAAEAKRQYKPLQEIATRTGTPILCVTHLNAGGKVLGRRAVEKVRVVIQMEQPDPEGQPTRRKLWVSKSKALRPAALGVSMGDAGNEYDATPPEAPPAGDRNGKPGPPPLRLRECMDWLSRQLAHGPARVHRLRNDAEAEGFNVNLLYRSRDALHVEESERDGRKWWELNIEQANGFHQEEAAF